jgi:hypothetical protein
VIRGQEGHEHRLAPVGGDVDGLAQVVAQGQRRGRLHGRQQSRGVVALRPGAGPAGLLGGGAPDREHRDAARDHDEHEKRDQHAKVKTFVAH